VQFGNVQYNCVIDNCLNVKWHIDKTRKIFTTRRRTYAKETFDEGSCITILGQKPIAEKLGSLIEDLEEIAFQENPKEIFNASVAIIQAAAVLSNGHIGFNCSGIRNSRNDPGIEVYDARENADISGVMPNVIKSTSQGSGSVCDMRMKKGSG